MTALLDEGKLKLTELYKQSKQYYTRGPKKVRFKLTTGSWY